jgi:hypothetical protein
MAKYNIYKLFRKAFGQDLPPPFTIEKAADQKTMSSLGQQYYAEDLSGREFFLPVWMNDFLIPFAVMGMTWKKTFVDTPMPERGGSVHELISIDDYVFSIRGLLVNEDGEFPEEDIIKLHDIFKINASVRLRSALSAIVLNGNFDEMIIIRGIEWPTITGVQHVKAFEIRAESDMIFDLNVD